MKEFTFRLKADVSYLEEQFKGAAAELANMAAQAGKTEKKLEVFQEANAYLIQMEKMLGKIQKQYPDLFDKIFDGVDKQVKDALAPFKQMPEVIGQALDQVGSKMQDVLSGKNKAATVSEIKEWAKSIKHAADALDIKIDFGFLDDKKSSKAKVEDMVSVLKQLREAYHSTSEAAQRANLTPIVPEVKEKKKRTKKKNAVIEENVDEGANIPGVTKVGAKPQKVNELTNSYIKLANAVQKIKDLSLDDEMDHDEEIEKELKNIQNAFKISSNEMMKFDEILNNTDDSFETTFDKIKQLLGEKFPSLSLDDVANSVQRFLDIQKELENVETDEEFEKLDNEANNIRDTFAKLSDESDNVFDGLMDDLQKDDAIKQLVDLFGIEIPQSIDKAADATQRFAEETEKAKNAAKQLKDIQDSEVGAFYDSKTGKVASLNKGDKNTVETDIDDFKNASMDGYDTRMHTHLTDVAAPSISSTQNDFNAWIQVFDYIKKQGIIANKEILTFDFSKLSKETLQEIANKYKELATPIIEDFSHLTPEKVQQLGGIDNIDEELQKQLRGVLDEIMQAHPGVMSSIPIALNEIAKSANETEQAVESLNNEIDEALTRDTGDTKSVMQQFQDIWKQRKDLEHDLNYNAKYIGDDAAVNEARQQIAAYDEDLKRLAASYVDLGGAVDDFKSKDKREFAADAVSGLNEQNKQVVSQVEETNQKLREQEDLYQQVRTAIKGTLEEVVGMDYTAVALEDIEREIKDGLITTLEEAIIRFKEMNNLTDDISIRPVGEYQRVAEDWDYYHGNRYVDEDEETVVKKDEYDSLKQKASTENIGDEYRDLEALRQKISEVEAAIVNKTLAFHQEADAVEVNVKDEIDRLELLRKKLEDIDEQVQAIGKIDLGNHIDAKPQPLNEEILQGEQIGFTDNQLVPKTDTSDEVKEINTLEDTIDKVKIAINNKTEAFEAEKNLVSQYIKDEIGELQKLINKLRKVQENAKIKLSIDKDDASVDGSNESKRYVTDKYGERKTWYRGLRDSMGGGLVSNRYHGGTFFTDNLDLAKEYSDYTKVESANLSMMNPLEIEGNGANWNRIEYLGNSADEASIKIKKAREELNELAKEWNGFQGLQINDLLSESDFNEFESTLKNMLYDSENELPDQIRDAVLDALANATKNRDDYLNVSNDDSNIYGTHDTNKFVEYAQNAGYDGVVFKNIIDSFSGDVKDLSNVIVAFSKDQIRYLDTISVDEKERKQNEFNKKYKNFGQYGEYDELRVSNTIEEIVKNVGQTFDSINKQLKRGLITETEADKRKENVLYDSKFDAYSSAQNIDSPEFLDFVRTSDIDIWGKDANEVIQLFEQFVESAHNEWNSLQNDINTPVETNIDDIAQGIKEIETAEEKVEAAVEQTNDDLDEQIVKEKELIKQKGTLNFLENEAKEHSKIASTKWSDDQKEAYEQLIAKIQEYKKSKSKLSDEELNSIRQIVNGYKIQAQTIVNAQESAEKASKAFGLKEINKATGSKNNLEALSRGFDSKAVKDGLESVRVAYEALSDAQKKFNDGHNPTDEEEIAYKNLVNQYNEAAKALDNLFKASKKMSDNGRWSAPIEQSDLDNIYKLETAMQNAIRAAENGRVKFGQFNKETGELEYSVRRSNGTWDHFKAQVDQAGMAVVGLNGKIKTTNGIIRDFTGGIATKFKNAMQVFSGYDLFFEGVAQVKKGVQYVRDIDTALTELKKVTNETDEAYAQFLQTASKTAGVVGSTVKDITTMTADWSRLNI